ncbi:hypothetical protein [Candidatus Venteria ishoeyi]|uniref:Uncharacterized protein n=1 Tax=Candidatus Venteria ishoeyi TaxID=1899563 RepID=A0A1H6F2R6_9GAMM|nr:hypothetical protein [Candidatus Venteria ishoeyi]SEH04458.1 Uncharacterised protein [Candidatus Venteria ishoeyi]
MNTYIRYFLMISLMLCVFSTASARTCLDLKKQSFSKIEASVFQSCQTRFGATASNSKRKHFRKIMQGQWNSQYTLHCFNVCGARKHQSDSECANELIDDFVQKALAEILPGLTKNWCMVSE